eukprot:1823318-Prymnesium_polylepis.1
MHLEIHSMTPRGSVSILWRFAGRAAEASKTSLCAGSRKRLWRVCAAFLASYCWAYVMVYAGQIRYAVRLLLEVLIVVGTVTVGRT